MSFFLMDKRYDFEPIMMGSMLEVKKKAENLSELDKELIERLRGQLLDLNVEVIEIKQKKVTGWGVDQNLRYVVQFDDGSELCNSEWENILEECTRENLKEMYEQRCTVIKVAVNDRDDPDQAKKRKFALECLFWLFEPFRLLGVKNSTCEDVKEWRSFDKCKVYSLSINDGEMEYFLEECETDALDIQRLQCMMKILSEPEVNDSNLGVDLTEEPLHLTRTQKNHPPTLVIGDIQSPMITRKQSKSLPNPHLSMISVFLSQTEPKKAYDAMKDPKGIDYDDVFAPVARIEAIRLFLAFASYKGFKVYQMDVKSAFLYGTIDEEVYVSQPPGFEDPKYPDKVYKLRKALYGLHQAPRAWYDTLSSYLLENKFERGVIDKTLFIKRTKTDMLLVQIYVDDIIFGSTKDDMCKEFEELMHKKFKMSSMGELTFFLGLQVKQKPEGIFINQSKYVASMLQKFGMNDAKPASTPMETHKHLTADVEGEEVDVHHYRSMIGSLMYLTASRPDIMFAVCVCARFQVRPKESHLQAVKRIFKYLKGQPRLGLWYPNDSSFDLVAYTDSDYGGANLDRKSTSGGCQFLGGRLVSWQCKKQTTVSQSTTEAEYIAASQCCSQVLWIQNQMKDYGLSFLQTPIYIDNNSAISIVNNPVKHSKTKHIEIKYHFIRDCNEKKIIQVLKVHTDDQYADLFTKAFDVGRFTFLVTSVGMMNSE
ncbi:hypothetical protein OSB04_017291 [Centaurea solstitialis]|uniref:Reverse transcriptase Ty1/copia-type domain-containing protein n=1 Tax=Centaurea solstitialis TaxID=347529 RepID=A0AA38TFT1_9ASTR|nr:hypothetical protein OSB04_017291 [Centaurea solstitialis]